MSSLENEHRVSSRHRVGQHRPSAEAEERTKDGSPLALRPEVIERAAAEVVARRADADADDVLLWAEAQQAAKA